MVALQILFAGFQQPQKSSSRSFLHGEHPQVTACSPWATNLGRHNSVWNYFSFPFPEAKIRALCQHPKAEWKHHSCQGPHPRLTKGIVKSWEQPQQPDGNEVVIPSFSLFKPQQKRRAPGQALCQATSPLQCHRSLHYLLQKRSWLPRLKQQFHTEEQSYAVSSRALEPAKHH